MTENKTEEKIIAPPALAIVAGLLALIDTHANLIAATADGVHDYGDPT